MMSRDNSGRAPPDRLARHTSDPEQNRKGVAGPHWWSRGAPPMSGTVMDLLVVADQILILVLLIAVGYAVSTKIMDPRATRGSPPSSSTSPYRR